MATSLPNSSSQQPRRYRLVDYHGQTHLEHDEHFDSIEEAWSFAIRWWHQQQPTGELANQVGLGLEVSTESDSWHTLSQLQGGTLQSEHAGHSRRAQGAMVPLQLS
jgi:hypothetical protein